MSISAAASSSPVAVSVSALLDHWQGHRRLRWQGYVYLRSLGIEPPPFFERE